MSVLKQEDEWRPYCGREYGQEFDNDGLPKPNEKVSGDPVVCDKPVHGTEFEMHWNSELQFGWWSS